MTKRKVEVVFERTLKPLVERLACGLARRHRRTLRDVLFVGVTGSYGKTTTQALIAAVLGARGPGVTSRQLNNSPYRVARTILTVRPRHRWCVHELGGYEPGVLARSAGLLQPSIGVITHVGTDHYSTFRGPENVALEKGTLAERLPPGGVAVLNADDPLVAAMRARTRARVITCGLARAADVRGEHVASAWPERLSLEVVCGAERVRVATRLLGAHWAHAVLAALAAGLAAGVPLREAARRIAAVEPIAGRLSVMESHRGITYVVDTWKASLATIPAALDWLRAARASRKIVVVGTLSDLPGNAEGKYRGAARAALSAADVVAFVGPNAGAVRGVAPLSPAPRLLTFAQLRDACDFLSRELRPGDLVLLKGSSRADHLERLALAAVSGLNCWRIRCGRIALCSACPRGRRVARAAAASAGCREAAWAT